MTSPKTCCGAHVVERASCSDCPDAPQLRQHGVDGLSSEELHGIDPVHPDFFAALAAIPDSVLDDDGTELFDRDEEDDFPGDYSWTW